ncbi:hypothetical protein BJV38_004790 [Clostridium beijerinckii]|uniref:DEAD/DEAH box helicase n=1 Tax=Clostridium beijerinckii TaxID=1520 RepID=UPI00156FD522|nr:DEAD/DEAH box helicase [Clostridium beijerinckii]NRT32625.1 hypothetical protein [Clostridium beijerinckii]NRT47947.1 hypothetical protein [Clostridium beijerinckii]NRZ23757.1 hypothetical protein [Clostridium beijerinckii]
MGRKVLNLKWVTDAIGQDYKTWRKGDIIRIQAQTGTGKTYFITGDKTHKGLIDTIEDYEKMIYICNRTELKKQIKKDLLEKYDMEVPYLKNDKGEIITNSKGEKEINMVELDKITVIKNITITSYHAISFGRLDNIYLDKNNSLDDYDYIICDECHFFMTDAGYNNKAYLALEELVKTRHRKAIKVFISATMDEVNGVIEKMSEKLKEKGFGTYSDFTIHTPYTTGIDYSYLNVQYFKQIKDIVQLIKNDKTNDKWIIFVTSKEMGEKVLNDLEEREITAKFIHANTSNKDAEKVRITSESKFNSKVLICTKCLDNGVNIKDEMVKNMVIMTYDKCTFIQEIGRRRLNIKDAPEINLYIPMYYKKTFQGKIDENYKPKIDMIDVFEADQNSFKRQYNNDLDKLPHDIFYLDKDNKWTINDLGYARVIKDRYFAITMVEKFEKDKFAYIKEQLKWLELENTFAEFNLIEDVADDEEVKNLESFLENCLDRKILEDEQVELCKILTSELLKISREKLQSKKKMHPNTVNSILQNDLKVHYNVTATNTSKRIDGKVKKYTYWTIIKTVI